MGIFVDYLFLLIKKLIYLIICIAHRCNDNVNCMLYIRSVWREIASEFGRWQCDFPKFRDRYAILYLITYGTYEIDKSRGDRIIKSDARFNGNDKSFEKYRNRSLWHEASVIAHYAKPRIWDQTLERYNGN